MYKFVFSTWPLVEATCPLKPTAFFILLKLFIIIIIILYLFVKLQIYHKITFSSDNLRCFFPVVNQLIVTRSKKKNQQKPALSHVRNAWHFWRRCQWLCLNFYQRFCSNAVLASMGPECYGRSNASVCCSQGGAQGRQAKGPGDQNSVFRQQTGDQVFP